MVVTLHLYNVNCTGNYIENMASYSIQLWLLDEHSKPRNKDQIWVEKDPHGYNPMFDVDSSTPSLNAVFKMMLVSVSKPQYTPNLSQLIRLSGDIETNPGPPPGSKDLWQYLAQPRLWLTVKDPEKHPEKDPQITDTTDTTTNETKIFSKLSPSLKWNLITSIAKPHSASYHKDKSMSIQVLSEDCNKLLSLKEIEKIPVSITKHHFMNNIRGTIKNQTLSEMTEEEIKNGLTDFNCFYARHLNSPERDKDGNIVRTIDNKLIWRPNGVVVISLEKEVLPPKVLLCGMSLDVEPYKPEPLLCKCCFQYGHLFKTCPNKAIRLCSRCSQRHHTNDGERCRNNPHCRSCEENEVDANHMPTSRECPKYKREAEIALIKETHKIPYWRAQEILDGKTKNYSNITRKNVHANVTDPNMENRLTEMLHNSNRMWEDKMNQLNEMVVSLATSMQAIITALNKDTNKDSSNQSVKGISPIKFPQVNNKYSTPTTRYVADNIPAPKISNSNTDSSSDNMDTDTEDDSKDNDFKKVQNLPKKFKCAEQFIKQDNNKQSTSKQRKYRKPKGQTARKKK